MQYRRVSSEIRSQVPSKTLLKMAYTNSVISGRAVRLIRINVSNEIREANVFEGQSCHAPSLPQLQVIRGPQQPVKCNQNAECRQIRLVHRQ